MKMGYLRDLLIIVFAFSVLMQYSESRKKHLRIMDGQYSKPGQFPYTASLHHIYDRLFGAGAIIGTHWVLTGAQTMLGFVHGEIVMDRVFVQKDIYANISSGTRHVVKKVYIHELFNDALDHDIALLKVNIPFQSFAKIGSSVKYGVGCHAHAIGWGRPTEGEPMFNNCQLQRFGEVELFNFKECQEIYKSIGVLVTKRMICAYSLKTSPCLSDGGGPLFLKEELIGIISWGGPGRCVNSIYPGVYTRVSAFRKWIEDKINNHRIV